MNFLFGASLISFLIVTSSSFLISPSVVFSSSSSASSFPSSSASFSSFSTPASIAFFSFLSPATPSFLLFPSTTPLILFTPSTLSFFPHAIAFNGALDKREDLSPAVSTCNVAGAFIVLNVVVVFLDGFVSVVVVVVVSVVFVAVVDIVVVFFDDWPFFTSNRSFDVSPLNPPLKCLSNG